MRVLVCGSRTFADSDTVDMILDAINACVVEGVTIIDGAASGADALAEEWADDNDIPNERYPADWLTHGKSAGPIRNQQMLDAKPDAVVAFVDKPLVESRGTKHMTDIATAAGIAVYIVEVRNR